MIITLPVKACSNTRTLTSMVPSGDLSDIHNSSSWSLLSSSALNNTLLPSAVMLLTDRNFLRCCWAETEKINRHINNVHDILISIDDLVKIYSIVYDKNTYESR